MALSFGTAKANSFDVNGTYLIPSSGTLSGTLNIDVIAGTVISADIIVQGFPEFTTGLLSGPVSGHWSIIAFQHFIIATPLGGTPHPYKHPARVYLIPTTSI